MKRLSTLLCVLPALSIGPGAKLLTNLMHNADIAHTTELLWCLVEIESSINFLDCNMFCIE